MPGRQPALARREQMHPALSGQPGRAGQDALGIAIERLERGEGEATRGDRAHRTALETMFISGASPSAGKKLATRIDLISSSLSPIPRISSPPTAVMSSTAGLWLGSGMPDPSARAIRLSPPW